MTNSRLPEFTVTCRTGHDFLTRAHSGQNVDCPECRAAGTRVKVWIPKDRPRTARELAKHAGTGAPVPGKPAPAGASPELAARWESEPPWDGIVRRAAGRPGDACPECEGPISWEPGRTLIYCEQCQRLGLPAAVTDHYARQARTRAEVATRPSAPGSAELRNARVRLRARAQRMTDTVGDWIDDFDPADLNGGAERLALDYQAELAAWLPEIRAAASEAELADIAEQITAITDRAASSGANAVIERHRQAADRQRKTAAREALEDRARTEIERQRQRQQEAIAARPEPKAIERKPASAMDVTAGGAALFMMIERGRQAKAARLAEHGTCGFQHRKPVIAERLYGVEMVGYDGRTGYQVPGTSEVRACAKHFTAADAWIETATVPAGAGTCYWELGS